MFKVDLLLKGVSAIKRWSAEVGHLESEDVIISADVDEVLITWLIIDKPKAKSQSNTLTPNPKKSN